MCEVERQGEEIMGAGGRHWGLLVQKFKVSACAGVDVKSSVQHASSEDSQEALEAGGDPKEAWVDYELRKEEGAGSEAGEAETDALLEAPEKVIVTGSVTKEELGRSTWTFLHTLAAQFPDKPTKQQQKDAKELLAIISRLYPCQTCAEHFKEVLKTRPPRTSSGIEFSEWMCQAHNVVNKRLGKPEFPCDQVDFRWGSFDCDGACSYHPQHK